MWSDQQTSRPGHGAPDFQRFSNSLKPHFQRHAETRVSANGTRHLLSLIFALFFADLARDIPATVLPIGWRDTWGAVPSAPRFPVMESRIGARTLARAPDREGTMGLYRFLGRTVLVVCKDGSEVQPTLALGQKEGGSYGRS